MKNLTNKNSKTVLWVENNSNLVQEINEADFNSGYKIIIFNNETAALAEVLKVNPDIIVWSINFSQEDIFENLKKLGEKIKMGQISLVITSAFKKNERLEAEFKNKLGHYFENCVFENCDINKIVERIKTL